MHAAPMHKHLTAPSVSFYQANKQNLPVMALDMKLWWISAAAPSRNLFSDHCFYVGVVNIPRCGWQSRIWSGSVFVHWDVVVQIWGDATMQYFTFHLWCGRVRGKLAVNDMQLTSTDIHRVSASFNTLLWSWVSQSNFWYFFFFVFALSFGCSCSIFYFTLFLFWFAICSSSVI